MEFHYTRQEQEAFLLHFVQTSEIYRTKTAESDLWNELFTIEARLDESRGEGCRSVKAEGTALQAADVHGEQWIRPLTKVNLIKVVVAGTAQAAWVEPINRGFRFIVIYRCDALTSRPGELEIHSALPTVSRRIVSFQCYCTFTLLVGNYVQNVCKRVTKSIFFYVTYYLFIYCRVDRCSLKSSSLFLMTFIGLLVHLHLLRNLNKRFKRIKMFFPCYVLKCFSFLLLVVVPMLINYRRVYK